MTVQSTLSFIDYVGDGVTLSFNFTFRADDVAWILVDFTDDFDTVTLNVDQDANPGGSVSYLIAPPALQPIRIQRNTPIDQQLDLQRYDPFDSESNEDTYDKLTMMIQDGIDALSNLVAPVTLEGSLLRGDILSGQWIEFGPGVGEFILPPGDGAPGQFLFTDGLGQLGFANIASGSLAGTTDGAILRYNLAANLYQEFTAYLLPAADGAAGEVLTTDGAGNITFQSGGVGGIDTFSYRFSISISMTNPGAGFIRFNNATPASVGSMAISSTDLDGNVLTQDMLRLARSYVITVRDPADPSRFVRYSLTSNPTDNGGFFVPGLSHIEGGTFPLDNAEITVQLRNMPYLDGGFVTTGTILTYDLSTGRYVAADGAWRLTHDALTSGLSTLHSNNNLHISSSFELQIRQPLHIRERAAPQASSEFYGQLWVRDDSPNVLMFTDDDDTDFVLNAGGGGGGNAYDIIPLSEEYTYSFFIASPPGAGEMRINNNPTLATFMFLDDAGNSGRDIGLLMAQTLTGDRIVYSQAAMGATGYHVFDVTGPPVDNGGWWAVPIVSVRGTPAALTNGVTAQIEVIHPCSSGGVTFGNLVAWNLSETVINPIDARVGIRLTAAGDQETKANDASGFVGVATYFGNGVAADYECMMDTVVGDAMNGASDVVNTWLPCTVTRTWFLEELGLGANTNTSRLRVRRVSDNVVGLSDNGAMEAEST